MDITKEMLDEREAALHADMSAVAGALQDVAYWRAVLERDEATAITLDNLKEALGAASVEEPVPLSQG